TPRPQHEPRTTNHGGAQSAPLDVVAFVEAVVAAQLLGDVDVDTRGVGPQAVQIVDLAGGAVEDVGDDVAVVEQGPLPGGDALAAHDVAIRRGGLVDGVGDRDDVAVVAPGAQHEEVGVAGHAAHVDDDQ